jgi:hypothetical protein
MRRWLVLAAMVLAMGAAGGCSCVARPTPPAPSPQVVWPLLGTPAPSAEAVTLRVVCVKVDNEPPAQAVHAGVADADVVYETPIEGEDTRYAALFQSKAPAKVGPVRSARVSDTFIVPQYRALLAHVGGDFVVETAIKSTPNVEDMDEFKVSSPYFRTSGGPPPHNDYVSITSLRKAAVAQGFPPTETVTGLEFGSVTASATAPATRIGIPFSSAARVQWTWAAASHRWQRSFNGSPSGDAGSASPYEASNVAVMYVVRTRTKALDPAGNPTFAEHLVGSGRAIVFRDGRRYDCMWSAGTDAPPTFATSDGSAIPLAPGQTWFEVVPDGTAVTSQ